MAALKKLEQNRKGFLIVINEDVKVVGVLTDGDIRRALIRGASVRDQVQCAYHRDFASLSVHDSMREASELFKKAGIEFLPIVDDSGFLCNILTKKEAYELFLQDIRSDLSYDFLSLDESVLEFDICQRPWGFYKTTILNNYFQSKILSIYPGAKLSLQSHQHREEYWIVVHGKGRVWIDLFTREVIAGDYLFIPKGARHSLQNIEAEQSLIVNEVQIGDYFGEDDIIRYEDIYNRV